MEKIKIESYHIEEIFLLIVGREEFVGRGDCYLNRQTGKPFSFHDVDLLSRVKKLEKWSILS